MTQASFTAKAYEILDKGRTEIGGKIYYSEESVMLCLEWMKDNLTKILEVDTEKLLDNFAQKLTESFKIT